MCNELDLRPPRDSLLITAGKLERKKKLLIRYRHENIKDNTLFYIQRIYIANVHYQSKVWTHLLI